MRKLSLGLAAIFGLLVLPASAMAAQTFNLTPSLSGKLGGAGVVHDSFTIAAPGGIPSPLTGLLTSNVPAGLTVSATGFPTCSLATVQASGGIPPRCPSGSLVGTGSATFTAQLGSVVLNEHAAVKAYIIRTSPLTVAFWGSGTTPIADTQVFTATLEKAEAPYSFALAANTPVIPTVPGGPNASVTQFNVSLGATVKTGKTSHSLFTLPKRCTGKLAWGATANYADGTKTNVSAVTACP